MGMVVQHNMNALSAYNKLNANVAGLKKSSEKLSSGYRINRAGDDAAGLAISEKMRSQIRGLNQAVRNSQDGINMVQTFEGAAQETHSILQRMKELATESANGTYDNPTDRAAIQLEFEQLNDELNQIADTDFNGTIVLNGGEMADGLKQVDGEFDYKNKADQVAADNAEKLVAMQADAQAKIDAATKKLASAQKVLNNTKIDMSNNGGAAEWNTVDNNQYGATEAAAIFGYVTGATKADGTTADGTDGILDTDGTNLADLGATSVSITFEYNKDNDEWTAIAASANDKNGDAINIDTTTLGTVATTTLPTNTNTGAGGFSVDNTTANAIFDATAAKTGDTVTLIFTNNASETVAPNNIGMDADSLDKLSSNGVASDPTVAIHAGLTDDKMTQEVADALKILDNSNFVIDYSAGTASLVDENDIAVSGFSIASAANAGDASLTDYTISYKLSDGTSINLATVTAQGATPASTGKLAATPTKAETSGGNWNSAAAGMTLTAVSDGAGGIKWQDAGGNDVDLTTDVVIGKDATNADQKVDVSDLIDATGAQVGDTFDLAFAIDGTDPKTINITASNYVATKGTSGKVSFGIAVDAFKFSTDGGYTVKAGKDTNINSDNAVAAQKAFEKAKAELKAAQDAYPTSLPEGVTKADAYDNSTARMTYTDNITLQTGARTKDAVNFTFSYNRDGSADMGDLKANLNLSSRADGLNTANLSLANQKDANYAIDQIDKAINKTSMVRATFGAIQNRLEHKITNLTTTSENLQEAESSIRDTDMASEMMNYTKYNILQQAAQSMLAQANQQPQSILQLLG